MNMNEDLLLHIHGTYDGGCWEQVTSKMFQEGTIWDVWKFERDVEYDGELWRCVVLERCTYSEYDPDAVDSAETILAEAWKI